MEFINYNSWPRKEAFEFFSTYDYPYAQITSSLKLGNLPILAKARHISFYGLMTYLVLEALNSLDAYHYGLLENKIVYYPSVGCSFTVLDTNDQICFSEKIPFNSFSNFMADFCRAKSEAEQHQKRSYIENDNSGIVYISCVPWVDLVGMLQPMKTSAPDSIPRVTWGKYIPENDGFRLNLNLQVHHGFQDGKQIADFFILLQNGIDSMRESWLK